MTPRGLFVGLATVDMQYLVDAPPARDAKTPARDFLMATGGPATNAAVTFAHLGGQARLLTRIGRHSLTSFMTGDLARYGVDVIDLAPDSTSLPTVSSVISAPATGERTIVTHRPAHDLPIDAGTIDAALRDVDIVLVDGHHMAVAIAVATEASRRGITVVLDGGSWKAGMADLLPAVDIAICSESFRPPGTHAPEQAIADLAGRGLEAIAITAGGEAIRLREGERTIEIQIEPVEVVDSAGAGDVLHGAFCYWRAAGETTRAALARAATVATRSCQSFGTRTWMQPDQT